MEKDKYQWIFDTTHSLVGAHINFKNEWQAYQFLIGDKMFALMGKDHSGDAIITLKGDPDHNRAMIELYSTISEGYYMNKIHWISIKLEKNDEISRATFIELLETSYQLIVNKLSKKQKVILGIN